MPVFRCLVAVSILAASLTGEPSTAGEKISRLASAIDGDSLEVGGQEMRLHGTDAPEW